MTALQLFGPAGGCALVLLVLVAVVRYRARRAEWRRGIIPDDFTGEPQAPLDSWPVCPTCGFWLTMDTVDGRPIGFRCKVHGAPKD